MIERRILRNRADTIALSQSACDPLTGTIEHNMEITELNREFLLNSRERAALLAEASRALSESFQYEETLEKLARIALRNLCDWCIVDVKMESGEFGRLYVLHRDLSMAEIARELQQDYPPHFSSRGVPSEVMRSEKTLLIPQVTDEHYAATRRSDRHEQLLRALGSQTYMCVPLRARGKFLGAITFVSGEASCPYSTDDVLFAEELCARAAIAVDNALLYRQAQREVQRREELMGIVSHDLKSPLAAILLGASMITHKNVTPAIRERTAQNIRLAVDRMNRLISDLLDLSQAEAGEFVLHLQSTPLIGIVNETIGIFQPIALERGVELRIRIANELHVHCDSERMIQAISNLLSNAIKFTPPRGIVTLTAEETPNGVLISVQDTGSGIAVQDLPRLFDRFWKGSEKARQGTGLGLSIVKAVVEAHQGEVQVSSEQGKGTVFTIRLPHHQSGNGVSAGEKEQS